jgi:hypothetical protein
MLLTLLMGSGVSAAEVLNPSFETTFYVLGKGLLPVSWQHEGETSCFNYYCSSSPGLTSSWKTDGIMSAALFSLRNKPVTPGKFHYFFQEGVDLTGIAAIKFDVRLSVLPNGGTFEHFEASFLVDGVPLWKQTVGGEYLDQEVNVAGLGGSRTIDGYELYGHRIEMRITALDTGTFDPAYWTQWDNIRLIEGPKTVPAVIDLAPDTIHVNGQPNTISLSGQPNAFHLNGPGKWIFCFIELPAGYNVDDIDEATVTLQNVPAYLGKEGLGKEGPCRECLGKGRLCKECLGKLAWHKDKVVDHDGDGIPERIFRFDGDAVRALVQPPEAILAVKGKLADKTPFEGSATVKVVDPLAELKAKLEELKAKVQDAKDKYKDDKKGCGDDKDMRDKSRDSGDKCRDNDGKCRDKDDKGAGKKR